MRRLLVFAVAVPFAIGRCASSAPADLSQATIIIYNRAEPESAGLARFYAQARHIPNDHIVGLDCSTEEEISRKEYDETVAEPLRKIFGERQWWTLRTDADKPPVVSASRINFVALIRGMPMKIRAVHSVGGGSHTRVTTVNAVAAAVAAVLAGVATAHAGQHEQPTLDGADGAAVHRDGSARDALQQSSHARSLSRSPEKRPVPLPIAAAMGEERAREIERAQREVHEVLARHTLCGRLRERA